MKNKNLALVVCSCDKYESAWHPFFELIKKYWPDCPTKIYLNTEKKSYFCKDLDIITINSEDGMTWSARLIQALEKIEEEYILFALEDFFLLGTVDQRAIYKCVEWMNGDFEIVECRLSTFETISPTLPSYKDSEFRECPISNSYRIDTQIAIWRKSYLLSLIDPSETPWQFEYNASKRSQLREGKLLWYAPENPDELGTMIFPYYNHPKHGYGIGWGKWRPKNRQWFIDNDIKGVDFGQLGELSEADVARRYKYLYINPSTAKGKTIKFLYRLWINFDHIYREVRLGGWVGVKTIVKKIKGKS